MLPILSSPSLSHPLCSYGLIIGTSTPIIYVPALPRGTHTAFSLPTYLCQLHIYVAAHTFVYSNVCESERERAEEANYGPIILCPIDSRGPRANICRNQRKRRQCSALSRICICPSPRPTRVDFNSNIYSRACTRREEGLALHFRCDDDDAAAVAAISRTVGLVRVCVCFFSRGWKREVCERACLRYAFDESKCLTVDKGSLDFYFHRVSC